jgi:uncharacterized protein (UPF0276 family)
VTIGRRVEGIGLGLRRSFASDLLVSRRTVDWLEITPENWTYFGGARRKLLDACAERWPILSHSVSLSIGGPDPLDAGLLDGIRQLHRTTGAPFWSDHVCYSSVQGTQLHDLLPLPFCEEAITHTAKRVQEAQERVGSPLVLENATFYAHMPGCTMDEATFLNAVIEESRCDLLLDVNNVYVNSINHGFDARAFIDRMPLNRVRELHLAGHTRNDDVIIDTHIGPIIDPVWDLYRYTLRRAGRLIPTLIEWDQEIPPLDEVLDEVDRARVHAQRALSGEP